MCFETPANKNSYYFYHYFSSSPTLTWTRLSLLDPVSVKDTQRTCILSFPALLLPQGCPIVSKLYGILALPCFARGDVCPGGNLYQFLDHSGILQLQTANLSMKYGMKIPNDGVRHPMSDQRRSITGLVASAKQGTIVVSLELHNSPGDWPRLSVVLHCRLIFFFCSFLILFSSLFFLLSSTSDDTKGAF